MAPSNGETSLDTRTFFFNRNFDLPDTPNSEALAVGGILKYASSQYRDFGFGLAYYGSFSLSGIVDRDKGGESALLQTDGENISFLGEGYIDIDSGTNQLKVGRQRLATPLMDDHDLRLLPTVYEAAIYRYKSQHETTYELGYVNAFSGLGSKYSGFEAPVEDWGEDGLAYGFIDGKLGQLSARAQYIETLEDSGTYDSYAYMDANYPIPAGNSTYIKGQIGHTGYQQENSGKMFGLKAGTTFGTVDVALLMNLIRDNEFKTIEAGPLYSDWQQGYANYEPANAVGLQLTFHPRKGSSIKLGYVNVESIDGDEFNFDNFGELNLDAQYRFNEASKIRLRFSRKNQSSSSDREDRHDFRIIYYYSF